MKQMVLSKRHVIIGQNNVFIFALLKEFISKCDEVFILVKDETIFGQRYIENKYKEIFGQELDILSKEIYVSENKNLMTLIEEHGEEAATKECIIWNCTDTADYENEHRDIVKDIIGKWNIGQVNNIIFLNRDVDVSECFGTTQSDQKSNIITNNIWVPFKSSTFDLDTDSYLLRCFDECFQIIENWLIDKENKAKINSTKDILSLSWFSHIELAQKLSLISENSVESKNYFVKFQGSYPGEDTLQKWRSDKFNLVKSLDEFNYIDHIYMSRIERLRELFLLDAQIGRFQEKISTFEIIEIEKKDLSQASMVQRLKNYDEIEDTMHTHTILSEQYGEIKYYDIGMGADLVLVNTLGATYEIWKPLIMELKDFFHITFWEHKGLWNVDYENGNQEITVSDHIEIMEEILKSSGITKCSCISWCSGIKISVGFSAKHPGIITHHMFLSGRYKLGGEEGWIKKMLELAGITKKDKKMTPYFVKYMNNLFSKQYTIEDINEMKEEEFNAILSQPGAAFYKQVLHYLSGPEAFQNFMPMLFDVCAYDIEGEIPNLKEEVCGVAGEFDFVIKCEQCQILKELLSTAKIHVLRGGTHFLPNINAKEVSMLFMDFVR